MVVDCGTDAIAIVGEPQGAKERANERPPGSERKGEKNRRVGEGGMSDDKLETYVLKEEQEAMPF